jgi:hypothetical protein
MLQIKMMGMSCRPKNIVTLEEEPVTMGLASEYIGEYT